MLVNVSVFVYYIIRKKERSSGAVIKYGIMPGIGFVVSIILWINIETNAKLLGAAWLLIGVIYLAVKTKGFKVLPPEMHMEE